MRCFRYRLVAMVATAVVCAASGAWLITIVLVAFTASIAIRDLIDDETRARRLAAVASSPPTDSIDPIDHPSILEQLVDAELQTLTDTALAVESLALARSVDRYQNALIDERLLRMAAHRLTTDHNKHTLNIPPHNGSSTRWTLTISVTILVGAATIGHQAVLVATSTIVIALLITDRIGPTRATLSAVHTFEIVTTPAAPVGATLTEAAIQARLRHICQERSRPLHRAHRYIDHQYAHRRLHDAARK